MLRTSSQGRIRTHFSENNLGLPLHRMCFESRFTLPRAGGSRSQPRGGSCVVVVLPRVGPLRSFHATLPVGE